MEFVRPHGYRDNLKAVILDWAGTTVDFGSHAPTTVFFEVFKRRGIEVTSEQVRQPMGLPKKDHLRAIAQLPSVAEAWKREFKKEIDQADLDAMYDEFVPLQLASLRDHAHLIPGTIETIETCRKMGLKIGSTTGYTEEMMVILAREAIRQGYEPDCIVVPSHVPAGRPYPYMCWQVATKLRVFPPAAIVKVGDTEADIQEGLNAGMWSVGVAMTGNELGLSEEKLANLAPEEVEARRARAYQRLRAAGAHVVIDGISGLPAVLEEINQWLAKGESP